MEDANVFCTLVRDRLHLRLMASELSWGMEYRRGIVLYGLTEMRTSPVYV